MKISCFPVGNLPYTEIDSATKMMLKLFEKCPYLALFPNMDKEETLLRLTVENIPAIKLKDNKVLLSSAMNEFKEELSKLDNAYRNPSKENLEPYRMNCVFLERYLQFIKRVKPKQTVINLLGAFSLSYFLSLSRKDCIITDKYIRKLLVQGIIVKALWIMYQIKELSPDTTPIIMLNEPKLNSFNQLKRDNEEVTQELVVKLLSKIIQNLQSHGAKVGIQCFEKCDWQLPLEAGVDIISFDAYNNPNNLNIIADKINEFLIGGGRINWGIVCTENENIIKSQNIDIVYNRFVNTIENLISSGVSADFAYAHSTVSIQSDITDIPLLFAEKGLILSKQLSKKFT